MKSPNLKSKRLILENWKTKEAKRLTELAKDPTLIFGTMPYPYLLKHAQEWIKKVKTLDNIYYFAIHKKESGAIIGFCWITLHDENEGLIVYGLGKGERGKGYATETVALMKDFSFDKIKLKKLVAETNPNNIASHKVLKKSGFAIVKKTRDKWFWKLKPKTF